MEVLKIKKMKKNLSVMPNWKTSAAEETLENEMCKIKIARWYAVLLDALVINQRVKLVSKNQAIIDYYIWDKQFYSWSEKSTV